MSTQKMYVMSVQYNVLFSSVCLTVFLIYVEYLCKIRGWAQFSKILLYLVKVQVLLLFSYLSLWQRFNASHATSHHIVGHKSFVSFTLMHMRVNLCYFHCSLTNSTMSNGNNKISGGWSHCLSERITAIKQCTDGLVWCVCPLSPFQRVVVLVFFEGTVVATAAFLNHEFTATTKCDRFSIA